ncbi:hypothetical protein BJ165DRAFT_714659 [Panaeolus papilionaceus]|nr:hypothetical protein BJ165DRAFT_714659 [Panaeolus papilionaceus]
MLPGRYNDDFYPSSSPGSSPPGTSYFDSSPPSSPGHVPAFESDGELSIEERRPLDPLSGLYIARSGKRPAGTQAVASPPSKKTRYTSPSTADTTPQSSQSSPMDVLKDRETKIWDEASIYAFDSASLSKHVKMQLGSVPIICISVKPTNNTRQILSRGYELKEISVKFIQDMSGIVFLSTDSDTAQESESMRPFVRAQTTSAILSSPQTDRFKIPLKATSSKSVLKGEGTGMELYLAANMITQLPAELWKWESLTVLSEQPDRLPTT